MRYEFWKKAISRDPPLAMRQAVTPPIPARQQDEAAAGHIFPKVYNVALYSTWEAQ
jgi:hypothetical protein